MKYKIDFDTQHNQFYIADQASLKKTDSASFWSDEAYEDRLAIGKGTLSVGTKCYGPIKGEIILLNSSILAQVLSAA